MGLFIRCDGDELYFLTDFPRIKVADIILNDYINWHINKIMVFRNCPEYTEKIMWNDLRENQQKMLAVEQGDYLQQNYGIDLKKSNKTSKYASNKGKK